MVQEDPMEEDEEKKRYLVDSRFTSRYQIDYYYAFDVYYLVLSLLTVSHSGLRVSVNCLNCKLLPEDSIFTSRLKIHQKIPDFPADFIFFKGLQICQHISRFNSRFQNPD